MNQVEVTTVKILRELEVPAHMSGYTLIKTAAAKLIEKPELIGCITKGLYVEVCKEHGISATKAERNIRHAVESMTCDVATRKKVLGSEKHMTNGEFLGTLVETVRLRMVNE